MRFILSRWGHSSPKIDFCKLKSCASAFLLTFFVQWRQPEIGCILFSLLQHLLTQEQSRLHLFLEKNLSHLLSLSVFPQFSLSLSPFLSSTFSVLFKYFFSIHLFPLPIHLSFVSCHGRIMSIDAMCFLIGFDMIVTSINISAFSHDVQISLLKHSVSNFSSWNFKLLYSCEVFLPLDAGWLPCNPPPPSLSDSFPEPNCQLTTTYHCLEPGGIVW